MARLIEEMEDRINEWYRNPRTPPEDVLTSLAVKLAGYRRDFKGEAVKPQYSSSPQPPKGY